MAWTKGVKRGPMTPDHLKVTRRKAEPLSPEVTAWNRFEGLKYRQYRSRHPNGPRISADDRLLIKKRFATVGSPNDRDATAAYNSICAMIFRRWFPDPRRGQSFKQWIAALPSTKEGLMKLVEFVRAVEKVEDLWSAQFDPVLVMQSLMTIPAGRVSDYVDGVLADATHQSKTVRGIFHERVIAHYRPILRGVFCEWQTTDYMAQVRAKLETITAETKGPIPSYMEQVRAKFPTAREGTYDGERGDVSYAEVLG